MAEEHKALRPWARKGGDKKRKTGGVRMEKEGLSLSSVIFDGRSRKKFIPFRLFSVPNGCRTDPTTSKEGTVMQIGRSIDADGHILEPPGLWQKNLEAKFKDRALGLARDKNGVESFIVDGHFSAISRGLGIAAAFGQPGEVAFSNEFSYMDGPPGAYEPHARVKLLDEEGIDAAVLYPTLGLLWEGEVNDPELAIAYCRVYNDWITEFCSPYPNRLYPVAHISLMDVDRAVVELKRVAKKGIKKVSRG